MTQSNYDSLGQGLKLYTDAMRRFLKERLIAAFPQRLVGTGCTSHAL